MSSTMLPRLTLRPLDAGVEQDALRAGYSAVQARVVAARLVGGHSSVQNQVRPSAASLDLPDTLPDLAIAVQLIADAVQNGTPIALVTDHDADGTTAHAILRIALTQWGAKDVTGYLSHRMTEGYGISDAFVDRVLPQLRPGSCIITADQGSTDELRIARLRTAGHKVVVTDHHGVPEDGPPPSAHAVVNPVRRDSLFPDRAIAGCHTALLVMAATRDELIRRGTLTDATPKLSSLLDLCAVGTIADASTLGRSPNNRAIVQRGLQLMNERPRPCWNAFRRLMDKDGPWSASDIAFQVAARINARGRLGDAMLGVEFLCSSNEDIAFELACELDANNQARRAIEKTLTKHAIVLAQQQVMAGHFGLCLWLGDDSHAGVHGITAARIVERFGAPTICLSPVDGDDQVVTGSIRSTESVHVREVLDEIRAAHPGLLLSGGGHAGAGGLRIHRDGIDTLVQAWDKAVRDRCGNVRPEPVLWVDGELSVPSLEHVAQLADLEPFGRGFEPPVFVGVWRIGEVRPMGDQTHLKLRLEGGGYAHEAVWFGAKAANADLPVAVGETFRFAYSVDANVYRGTRRLQLIIRGVGPVE